jgi:AraC-like DNA-binding protein
MKPMISISVTGGWTEAVAARGGNPGRILNELGLTPTVFSNAEGFIPVAVFTELLEKSAEATGDDYFGLHFGEGFNPKSIGPLTYVVLNSPTILTAIENAVRYIRVHNQAAKLSFDIDKERACLHSRVTVLAAENSRHHNEFSIVGALNMLRLMAGSEWRPQEVQFVHRAPGDTSEHMRIFGAPVLFGCPTNVLVMEPEFVARQVPAADPRLYRILRRSVDRALQEMPEGDELIATLRSLIAESVRDGVPKLARIAKKMGLSPRTLQRQLMEHEMGFKGLVDDTRRHLALSYLRDRKNCLTQVAFLLGYSELSAFNRAFRRWTGSTPLAYRRRPGH